jgi:hypothetical protein
MVTVARILGHRQILLDLLAGKKSYRKQTLVKFSETPQDNAVTEYRDKCGKKPPLPQGNGGFLIDRSLVRPGTFYAPRH